MIIGYDTRPDATVDEKLRSLVESIQMALNNIDAGTLSGEVNNTVIINGGSLSGTIDGDYLFVKNLDAECIKAVEGWIDKLLVQTHLLANEGQIFELDAIQVNASKIKTGTLDVERLIITQTDPQGHQQKYLVHWNTDGTYTTEKLDGNVIEDLTITADKIVSESIMTRHITTQNIEGTSGWINLREGTFFYGNGLNFATATNCISWNGSQLKIKADDFLLSSGKSLVDQVEDAIETWFYAVEPLPRTGYTSSSNAPASDWTTDDDKALHVDDIYFNVKDGKSYKWTLTSSSPNTYAWVEIPDGSLQTITTRITNAETQITKDATSIQSLASADATYIKPDGTTGENKLKSAITQNAQNINLKVSKDNVIGEINLSSEAATIAASKVNIQGVITAYNNGSYTKIDGDKIETSQITVGDLSDGSDYSTAKDNVTKIGSTGVWVTPKNNKPDANGNPVTTGNNKTEGTKIDANGMGIYHEGVNVAQYGGTSRVGTSSGKRVEINSSDVSVITDSTHKMVLGDTALDVYAGETLNYQLTSDTSVVSGKTYYTRSGSGTIASPYVYTAVASPSGNPHNKAYYEAYYTVDNVAQFGSTSRVGKDDTTHMYVDPSGTDAGIKFKTNCVKIVDDEEVPDLFPIGDIGFDGTAGWTDRPSDDGGYFPKGAWFTFGLRDGFKGYYSSVLGFNCVAAHNASLATGIDNQVHGSCAMAVGMKNTIGDTTKNSGNSYTSASQGNDSAAIGYGLKVTGQNQLVTGSYNTADANKAFIIGNGSSASSGQNVFTVAWNGKIQQSGYNLITVDTVSLDNQTLQKEGASSGTYNTFSKSCSKTGYTPIGVIGFEVVNASSSGTLCSWVSLYECYLNGTNVIWSARNHNTNGAAKVKFVATVLYVSAYQGV